MREPCEDAQTGKVLRFFREHPNQKFRVVEVERVFFPKPDLNWFNVGIVMGLLFKRGFLRRELREGCSRSNVYWLERLKEAVE